MLKQQPMYWWKIQGLKKELSQGPLSEQAFFPYLLADVILVMLGDISFPGEYNYTDIDLIAGLLGLVIAVLGTYYLYYWCNNGPSGENFLQRYFALGWVIGVRLLVMVMLPAFLILFFILAAREDYSGAMTWGDVAFIAFLSILYFWRVGKHMKDVANQGKLASKETELNKV